MTDDTKGTISQLERLETHDEEILKDHLVDEKTDKFGAHAKTDPKEIALVKKLDRHILVSYSNLR